jgi:hypothetical protein
MELPNNFAVFILSHGRADNMYTYHSLLKAGYTGKIYILIDNEDKTADRYYELYGDKVIMFDKKAIAEQIDTMDNFEGRKAIVYARNANFKIAKDLGIKYFMQFDDDYTSFNYRFNNDLKFTNTILIKNLDRIFIIMLNYFINANLDSLAMAQGGDFLGGEHGGYSENIRTLRKCMNTWLFDVEKPIYFTGKMNEDHNASVYLGGIGYILLTILNCFIIQVATQKASGGMSDIYADNGTFVKTYYSIMKNPSCVKVSSFYTEHARIHHLTNWNNAVPVILNEKYKK